MSTKKKTEGDVLATNRKARRDYFIEETMEAGIVLQGTEVKSVRGRRININDSHARITAGEVYAYGIHISPYEYGNRNNHDPVRPRKLLLHKKQIMSLMGLTERKGYALVLLKAYLKRGIVKIELGVGQGKRQYDKRDDLRRKAHELDASRALKGKNLTSVGN